jgi:hypothetical protein
VNTNEPATMAALTGMLYATLGALLDGDQPDTEAVMAHCEPLMTPDAVMAGVDLYETLIDFKLWGQSVTG